MATTERGIYYTTGADDAAVADLNVITKQIADSTEAAIDAVAGRAVGGVIVATTNGSGQISVTLPTSPTGNWSVTASANSQFILVSVSGTTATFTVYALSGGGPSYPLVLLTSDPTPLRIFYHAVAY